MDELFNILGREPRCAEAHVDFRSGEVFGLYLFKRRYVRRILGIVYLSQ